MEPKVGERIMRDGKEWEVTSVTPHLTPFRKKHQDTKVEGYTLGLREVRDDRCPTRTAIH